MKLYEEFKLYENMWDDTSSSEAPTESRYIILTGDFPNKYYVHGLTSDGEKEAVDIYNKAMAQLPNFDCDIEVAELFDLTSDEISRLESMIGKEVTGTDADFIADFFVDGSRADSRYNNFNEALTEAASTTAKAIINRYNDNVADHILELEHEKAFADAEWFKDEWYALEDVEVHSDYYKLIVDRSIESDIDAEAIIGYAFESANIAGMDEAMSEGGVVYDEGDNWIYVERWVVDSYQSLHPSCPTGPDSTELPKLLSYIENVLKWEQDDYERDDDDVYILYDTSMGKDAHDKSVIRSLEDFAEVLGIHVEIEYEPRGVKFAVKVWLQPLQVDEDDYYSDDE